MNFLTEHGIGSYEELESRLTAVLRAGIPLMRENQGDKQTCRRTCLVMKHAETYVS